MYLDNNFFISFMTDKFGMKNPAVSPVGEQGSDRKYFRVSDEKFFYILMLYGNEKQENGYFFHIRDFLSKIDVAVPYIYSYNPDKNLIVLEDLGDENLCSAIENSSDNDKKNLYRKIIDGAVKIYTVGAKEYMKNPFVTAAPFDYELYKWEYTYFADNYLKLYRKISCPPDNLICEMDNLAKTLSYMKNSIIHRDLQSKNIIIKDRKPYFIDFQGLRPGLPEYDIASLLFDPYVDLDESIIRDLFDYYCNKMLTGEPLVHMQTRFFLCGIQRLMQALGAFCFLGLIKGKNGFLQYISPAEKKLSGILRNVSYFKQLPRLFA